MILWIDAQLSPSLAAWISASFSVDAISVQRLGLRDATDRAIFDAARAANAIVLTKDHDFVALLNRFGSPPKVIWLRCGNTSMAALRELLKAVLPRALDLLRSDEVLVEITDQVVL